MVRALRVLTVERGVDPRDFALLAFGGAGPLHAAQLAGELGISRIVIPRASGVLAALGLLVSPRRRDAQRSVFLHDDELSAEAIADHAQRLGAQAREALGDDEAELSVTYEVRYRGQAFELAVNAAPEPGELRRAFEAEHEERYGYSDPDEELELVTIRVSATAGGVDVALGQTDQTDTIGCSQRTATIDGQRVELKIIRGAPPPGTELRGPAVVELDEATLLIPPAWSGQVDDTGTIVIER
jgi:N-methylhydantoinase A